jgi:hypothetical protein
MDQEAREDRAVSKREFAERFIHLRSGRFSLEGRPYLQEVYDSTARRIVLRASRQVEKTTFLVNSIIYYAMEFPGSHILVVCPRMAQARVLSKSRLQDVINRSPFVARCLLGQMPRHLAVNDLHLANGTVVYFRASYHSPDSSRGIDADFLFVDEHQDIAAGDLPILEESLSHSQHRGVVLTGTPKLIDNHLEGAMSHSTAHEFKVPCHGCRQGVLLDEHCLGPQGPQCPRCLAAIDVRMGQWVARNPQSTWGDGFWINHLMVPWINYAELLERQRTYDPARFRNECLGLPSALGDHLVTREDIEACCTAIGMTDGGHLARSQYPNRLVGGIDWGGGATSHTVMTVGYLDDHYRFCVVAMKRLVACEHPDQVLTDVSELCRHFQLRFVAADGGGNGNVYNRMLYERLRQQCAVYAIHYSADGPPHQDGCLLTWPIGRSASIGAVFSRIKKRTLLLPKIDEMSPFVSDFTCVLAEYDDYHRTLKFVHPDGQTDDAVHATNYALQMAVYVRSLHDRYSETPPSPLPSPSYPRPVPVAAGPTPTPAGEDEDDLLD